MNVGEVVVGGPLVVGDVDGVDPDSVGGPFGAIFVDFVRSNEAALHFTWKIFMDCFNASKFPVVLLFPVKPAS